MISVKSVTHLSEKGIRDINEDRVLVNEPKRLYGVFDGASSLVPYASPDGKTGGYLAASIAAETFASSDLDLKDTALRANERIEEAHAEAGIDVSKSINRFSTLAAVARIQDDTAELLQIGDCLVIVIDAQGNATAPLGYVDQDIIVMRKWRQFADQGVKNIRELVWDDILRQREAANVSYGSLNGDKKLKNHILTTKIPLDGVASILLLTDGMFLPKADPDASDDWNEYAECYQKSGLAGLFEQVRRIEKSDPTLVKYPRFKLHDDSSGVAIDITHCP